MKELLLMRHAKSDWYAGISSDHDRPLNKRGEEDAARMGKLTALQSIMPDFVFVSSAQRTQQTFQIWSEACTYNGDSVTRREFYLSSATQYLNQINQYQGNAERMMVIGHNPVMEELLSLLIGGNEYPSVVFPTAAMALLELNTNSWKHLKPASCNLKWFVHPRFVKRLI